jgi:hypothetical protein
MDSTTQKMVADDCVETLMPVQKTIECHFQTDNSTDTVLSELHQRGNTFRTERVKVAVKILICNLEASVRRLTKIVAFFVVSISVLY